MTKVDLFQISERFTYPDDFTGNESFRIDKAPLHMFFKIILYSFLWVISIA